MKNFLKEFKEFAIKGNVIDLAVGVMIGSAFGSITSSLVNDIFMPLIAMVIGDVNFTDLKIVLKEAGENTVTLNYGNFIQNVVNFLILAFIVFWFVKFVNKLKKPAAAPEPAAPVESDETKALKEIIEILKEKK